MRFKQLTIHNLASIEYAVLNFETSPLSDSPIFLICGDTGSGKSTLLDAVCLSLYDTSPRFKSSSTDKLKIEGVFGEVANNDVKQILRKNTSEGLAQLVFEGNDGKVYTSSWKLRTIKKRKVEGVELERAWNLDYEEGGRAINLSGIEEIKERIVEAVGLTYDQFCRTSLLAQGEFTKFLKSNDNEKSAILEKLTDTAQFARVGAGIYNKMTAKRAALEDKRKEIALTKVLTDEETSAYITEKDALSQQLKTWTQQAEDAQKKYDALKRREQAEEEIRRTTSSLSRKRDDFAALLGGVEALKAFIAERDKEITALEAGLTNRDVVALEQRRDKGKAALMLIERWEERVNDVEKTEKQVVSIEKEREELQRLVLATAENLKRADADLRRAQAVLEATQKGVDDAAKAVRARAEVGETCPVCGNKIEKILTDEFFETLYAPAKRSYDEAEKIYKQADNKHKTLQAHLKAKADNLSFVGKRRDEQKNEAALLQARLAKAFGREVKIGEASREKAALLEEDKRIAAELEVLRNLEKLRVQREKCVAAYQDAVPLLEALFKRFDEPVKAGPVAPVKDLNPKLGLLQGEVAALCERRKQAEKERDAVAADRTGQQSSDSRESLEAFLVQVKKTIANAHKRLGALEQMLKEDAENKRRLAKKTEEAAVLAGDFDKWERLNKLFGDATGSRFRRIVLNYIMDELLSYANEHLKRLTNRYCLESSFGSFSILVRDLLDGGSLRPASGLSGGEGFLVSLALAFGLNSFNGSRVTTDILFIDEGFGTLSNDYLDAVLSALENLHNTDGRKVGLISHIPVLRERIRTQIRVERENPTKSVVRVVGL